MTRSKGVETVVQVASAFQNAINVLSRRVVARGGNLTEALVRLGMGENRYGTEYDRIAFILAKISQMKVYTISRGTGLTDEQLLLEGGFVDVWDAVVGYVRSGEFVTSITVESVDLEMIEFDYPASPIDVLSEFKRRGLQRPWAEDALHFGRQYRIFPSEQEPGPFVFLHQPWKAPDGDLYVLVLDFHDGNRRLRLIPVTTCTFSRNCRFLAIHPRQYTATTDS